MAATTEYKLAKDALVSSLFELSKAANEVSKNAIDFFNVSQLDAEDALEVEDEDDDESTHAIAALAEVATEKKRKTKDPNLPKKPLTTYILYSNDIRARIQEEHKDWAQPEIAREISKLWSQLDSDKKDEYKEIYEKDKLRYLDEMAKYNEAKAAGEEYIAPSVVDHNEAVKLKKEALAKGRAAAAVQKRAREIEAAADAAAEAVDDDLEAIEPEIADPTPKKKKRSEDGDKEKKKKKKSKKSQTINIE